jgi:AraC family transcriptional regulator
MDELAESYGVSKFYMHKIFKEIFGRNIYESINSIRLQKASNLLLINKYSTISEVAQACGYSSQTSFIRSFKERFSMTPKVWRNGGYLEYSNNILKQLDEKSFDDLIPKIVKMPAMDAYYIRHNGYNGSIKQTWQKIQTWIYTNDLNSYEEIALFHDNPTVTPLNECQYVACVVNKDIGVLKSDRLPKFKIAGGVYAKFELSGEEGDLLRFIKWLYHVWLPRNEYETTTKPPYAVYRKNKYLSDDKTFELDFYLSIKF